MKSLYFLILLGMSSVCFASSINTDAAANLSKANFTATTQVQSIYTHGCRKHCTKKGGVRYCERTCW